MGSLRCIHWIPAISCAALIFWFSHQSRVPALVDRVPDEAGHSVGYFLFGLSLVAGATSTFQRELTGRTAVLLWLVAVSYGLSDEFHQSFIPGRMPSAVDVLVDAVGSGVALCCSWLMWRPGRR